jgi:N-acetylmuramoyl-L-alanine amidase
MTEHVDEGSCLQTDGSGLPPDSPEKRPQTPEEVLAYLEESVSFLRPVVGETGSLGAAGTTALPPGIVLPNADDLPGESESETQIRPTRVAAPRFKAIYQARAVTRKTRRADDIDTLVLHTPEGPEAATLSVLNGTRAGFDLFLASNYNLYKCNDWFRYVSWHAGDRAYNHRSVGLEIDAYAATSGGWPREYYRAVAHVCAWAIDTLNIPLSHATKYGQKGLIFHRTVTPKNRTDPGANFKIDLLIEMIRDILGATTPPEKRVSAKKIWFTTADPALKPLCEAANKALMSVGFNKGAIAYKPDDVRWASYKARHGSLGEFVCVVVGGLTEAQLHPDAHDSLRGPDGKWFPTDRSDLWDATEAANQPKVKLRWRLKAFADYERLDAEKVLDAYQAAVEGAPKLASVGD